MKTIPVLSVALCVALNAQIFTRGVGVYPGDPREDFSPSFHIDATTYRNLALHRPAYQSSAYDYNLTAQLITDGIRETTLPRWLVVSTENGPLPKHEREALFDDNWVTSLEARGPHPRVEIELAGRDAPPQIDRMDVQATVAAQEPDNQEWTVILSASDDGQSWRELGRSWGMAHPSGELYPSLRLQAPARSRFFRVEFESGRPLYWRIGQIRFFNGEQRVRFGGPFHFTSAWKSAGNGEEWVSVDLGARCTFDRVALAWIRRAAEGSLQVSDDAANWRTLQPLGATDDMRLPQPATARYVRVLMTRPESPTDGYILSEMEVYGRGGPVAQAKPSPAPRADGRIDLAGGGWKLQRDSLVQGGGETFSRAGFNDAAWLIATVPATVLSSYYNAGAVADPNFGDNQMLISDSFFYADFWYRTEFSAPAPPPGRHIWLNFDGVNWKAEVFLNGRRLGGIGGGFMRGRFDITAALLAGQKNALAVRIIKNATPGSVKQKTFESSGTNGGALGADNPTYHASIGWDWIPTIRGRNDGIWADVYLTNSGPVTVEDPLVTTALAGTNADVTIETRLVNHDAAPITGTLHGQFGAMPFELPVTLDASTASAARTTIHLNNPHLWWPNGYGDPYLYEVRLTFQTTAGVSDTTTFRAGVRQFTYSEDGGALRMWINGRRFIPRGGNWGFGESMLRYRAREYDAAVRYHRDMNFTMIRNWVGQIGDDAFFDACDRHGIVVWQDFWLANPWDGPDPDNIDMFLANARDFVRRIRNHPSIGLYVGRNEGYPPDPLERGFRALLAELHPGIDYIPSSADGPVSGHGPYQAMPTKFYFAERATTKFHSELGMPNIMTMDSIRLTMPPSAMWPQGEDWGLHDFTLHGAQGGASFRERIDRSYGGADNVNDWVELAQFVNYEGYRAMFEAQSKNRMGLLIWMSHPCWPSFVWETYDYFLDPTAGYFGAKKAAEPLHIQWNPVTDNVEVVNYSAGNTSGLTASARIFNMDGSVKWEKTATLDSPEDSMTPAFRMEFPSDLTPVHFIRLQLARAGKIVSDNFYWRGTEEGNYRALRQLPKARVDATTTAQQVPGVGWRLTTVLRNSSNTPLLMLRLKAVRDRTGDRILPALYSDNYVSLMPGEQRTITTEFTEADTRGEAPRMILEGFNLQ